jgi:hypothetical protein
MVFRKTIHATYIVRIYIEPVTENGANRPAWRGQVENAQTGASTRFTEMGDLLQYLEAHLSVEHASETRPVGE